MGFCGSPWPRSATTAALCRFFCKIEENSPEKRKILLSSLQEKTAHPGGIYTQFELLLFVVFLFIVFCCVFFESLCFVPPPRPPGARQGLGQG